MGDYQAGDGFSSLVRGLGRSKHYLTITESIPALLMGVATLWILPDYPQTAKFLTEREKSIIVNRLSSHAPSKFDRTWNVKQVLRLLVDPTFWTFSAAWFCHAVGGFGLSYVLPTVIFQLGKWKPVSNNGGGKH